MGLLYCCFGISPKDRQDSWSEESFCSRSTLDSNMTIVLSEYGSRLTKFEQGLPSSSKPPVPQQCAPPRTISERSRVAAMRVDKDSISALLNACGQVVNAYTLSTCRREQPYSVWLDDAACAPTRVPGAAAAQVQQEGSTTSSNSKQASPEPQLEPIPAGKGLTSWNAHQYAAFKAHWLQAAAANKLYGTEAGLAIHEAELAAYLKQDSTTLFQTSTTGKSNLRGMDDGSSSTSSCHKKRSSSRGIKLRILPTRGMRRQATSGGHSSSRKSGSEDSLSFIRFKIYGYYY